MAKTYFEELKDKTIKYTYLKKLNSHKENAFAYKQAAEEEKLEMLETIVKMMNETNTPKRVIAQLNSLDYPSFCKIIKTKKVPDSWLNIVWRFR